MPDTINLIKLDKTQYINIYEEANISVGSPIDIQSNSTYPIKISISTTQPTSGTTAYVVLGEDAEFKTVYIYAGENGCWVLGDGYVNVQESV